MPVARATWWLNVHATGGDPRRQSTIAYSVYSPDVYEGVYTESTAKVSGTLVIPDFILE